MTSSFLSGLAGLMITSEMAKNGSKTVNSEANF